MLTLLLAGVLLQMVFKNSVQALVSAASITYLLPQLWLFYRQKALPKALADFLFWCALNKIFSLAFYLILFFDPRLYPSYPSLQDFLSLVKVPFRGSGGNDLIFESSSDYRVNGTVFVKAHMLNLLTEGANVLLVCDFFILYLRWELKVLRGEKKQNKDGMLYLEQLDIMV